MIRIETSNYAAFPAVTGQPTPVRHSFYCDVDIAIGKYVRRATLVPALDFLRHFLSSVNSLSDTKNIPTDQTKFSWPDDLGGFSGRRVRAGGLAFSWNEEGKYISEIVPEDQFMAEIATATANVIVTYSKHYSCDPSEVIDRTVPQVLLEPLKRKIDEIRDFGSVIVLELPDDDGSSWTLVSPN